MTLEELHDNFAKYADIIHAATAAGIGAEYAEMAHYSRVVIHDTVRDVFTVLAGPSLPRTWGAMELAAKNAIEGVLNAGNPVVSAAGVEAEAGQAEAVEVAATVPKTKTKSKTKVR